jgi:glycosyltransferase involved in cell wall biosynthesis
MASRRRDLRVRPPADAATPFVSVVIAIRDEGRSIGGCLDAVLAQDYPPALMEVLVADGGSRDASRDIVEAYARRHGRVRLLDNPDGTIPAGLNTAIRAARGEIVLRVDARTRLAPDYVSTGVHLLTARGVDNVGGPVLCVTPAYMARVLALASQSCFGMGGAAVRYRASGERPVDTVYLGVYRRRLFETIGLYDEEMVRDQDDELNFRLRAAGGRVLMSPRMRSTYLNSASLRRFARQNFLYGYWKVRVFQKHPRMLSLRHFVPALFVAGMLASGAAGLFVPAARLVVAAAGGAWIAGALAAAALAARDGGWRVAAALPLTFAVLHGSWGLGFAVGLVRFVPRWRRPEPAPPALPVAAEPRTA